jgi:hypothetical protein
LNGEKAKREVWKGGREEKDEIDLEKERERGREKRKIDKLGKRKGVKAGVYKEEVRKIEENE